MIIVAVVTFIISPVSAQEQTPITIYAQGQKTYTIYVQPDSIYQNYYSNVMEDATTEWHNANPNINFVVEYSPTQPFDFEVQWIKDNTGDPWAGEALVSSNVMQVVLGDSFCGGGIWQPYSHTTLVSLATHELGHLLGMGHSTDPNNVMNPNRDDFEYAQRQYVPSLPSGGGTAYPLCNKWNGSSFEFNVSTQSLLGVNFYFVPSAAEVNNYNTSFGKNFRYYDAQGCYGKHVTTFQGTCSGMAEGGYLIINTPPLLVNTFTTVTVNLLDTTPQPPYYVPAIPTCQSGQQLEIDNNVGQYGQQCVQTGSTPLQVPASQLPVTGFVQASNNQYMLDNSENSVYVQISGVVNNAQGGKVVLEIQAPDGSYVYPNPDSVNVVNGNFLTGIVLDKSSQTGTYKIFANYQNLSTGVMLNSGSFTFAIETTPPMEQQQSVTGTLWTSQELYALSTNSNNPTPISIFGHVNNAQGTIGLKIKSQSGNENWVNVNTNSNGDFSYVLNLYGTNAERGTYTIDALYHGEPIANQVTFELGNTPQPTTPTFTVSTDKSSYDKGDLVIVSGTVSHWQGDSINLRVADSSGNNIIGLDSWQISSDGTFSGKIDTSTDVWKSGNYTFQGTTTTFTLTDKPKSCFLFWCW